MRDLLQTTRRPADDFDPQKTLGGFENSSAGFSMTASIAMKVRLAAEGLAEEAAPKLKIVAACELAKTEGSPCMAKFLDSFATRIYRRPLTPDEKAPLLGLYSTLQGKLGPTAASTMVLANMLQSPRFLYRTEQGTGAPAGKLTAYEVASELSYLFWGSMPDDALLEAAKDGRLLNRAEVERQARRLLLDPRTRDMVSDYYKQWLELDGIELLDKDRKEYGAFTASLASAMAREALLFTNDVFLEKDASMRTLLSSPTSFVNATLAKSIYEIPGISGTAFVRADLDPARRAGLLSRAAPLSILSHSNVTSPVIRGKFVLEKLLCRDLPPPPPDVAVSPLVVAPNATTRQAAAAHVNDQACAGCHDLIDPVGFGFENYDAIGRYRATEHGQPVDATGHITVDGTKHSYEGIGGLSARLAQSQDVQTCASRFWFRYALGRPELESEECTLRDAQDTLRATRGNLREFLVAITRSDDFYQRKTGGK